MLWILASAVFAAALTAFSALRSHHRSIASAASVENRILNYKLKLGVN